MNIDSFCLEPYDVVEVTYISRWVTEIAGIMAEIGSLEFADKDRLIEDFENLFFNPNVKCFAHVDRSWATLNWDGFIVLEFAPMPYSDDLCAKVITMYTRPGADGKVIRMLFGRGMQEIRAKGVKHIVSYVKPENAQLARYIRMGFTPDYTVLRCKLEE